MAWHEHEVLDRTQPGMTTANRHVLLYLVIIANVAALIFALSGVAEARIAMQTPGLAIYAWLALSLILSAAGFFLPSYPLSATRVGARIIVTGLPVAVVLAVLIKLP